MNPIYFFVIFTYLTQVQSTIAVSRNEIQSEIEEDVLQIDCSTYINDHQIIDSFPFLVHIDSLFRYPTQTYVLMNNSKVYYMNIAHQEFVPSIIYCLKHLSGLDVRNTSFSDFKQQLPIEIEYLASSLIHLAIYDTKIAYLPEQIGRLTRLQSLRLSNTGLMSLPDSIGELSSLITLYLPNNNLKLLPTTINNLRLLRQITLTNNSNLHSIEPLNGLPSLNTLDTRNCSIIDLPHDLPQLTNLYMSNNNLKRLDGIETLGNGTSVKKSFYFDMNYIRSVPSQIQYINNLHILNLNHNQLSNLPIDMFKMTTLSELHIRYNRFHRNQLEIIVTKFHKTNPNLKLYYKTKRKSVAKSS